MSITDRQRTELHRAAEEAMGPEPADSLMPLLPPVGWADVVTKHDLAELERRIDLRFEKVDLRFDALEDRLTAQLERAMRTYFIALLSSFAILLGVATAVAQQLS